MRPDVVVAGEQVAGVVLALDRRQPAVHLRWVLQGAGLAPERAGWATFAAFHFVLGHTIEEQAQLELTERGAWEPKLTVDGIENKLAATAFTADPAERFGYGLQLFLDGIRQQLT